jgi:endonuclease YncB( thermonuclease family)
MRITLNQILLFVVALLAMASCYFTFRVVVFKRSLNSGAKAFTLMSGQEAQVVKIIDGDEISVRVGNEQITVRMLGLYSYDPTMADPQVQPSARATLLFLEKALQDQKVELVFDELKYDSHKRLLAYVHKDGQDTGLIMISKGLSLAYTKYPFSRLHPYVLAEQKAREEKQGLWSDSQMALRSSQLRILWETERTRGE